MTVLVLWFSTLNPITPPIILIPIIQLPCAYSIGSFVGANAYRMRGEGRAVAINIAGDRAIVIISMLLSALLGSIPLGAYALFIIMTGNHILALGAQFALVILEILATNQIVPRMLKR